MAVLLTSRLKIPLAGRSIPYPILDKVPTKQKDNRKRLFFRITFLVRRHQDMLLMYASSILFFFNCSLAMWANTDSLEGELFLHTKLQLAIAERINE